MKDVYKAIMAGADCDEKTMGKAMADRRYVPMFNKIDSETADGIIGSLLALDLKAKDPITILIDCGGGSIPDGNQICDTMQALNSPVDALVIGDCGSMAVDVLLHCRNRWALPSARFFIHCGRSGSEIVEDGHEITVAEMMNMVQIRTALKEQRDKFYADRLKKSVQEILELQRLGEKYNFRYPAEEALKMGLIDGIAQNFKFWK